MIQERWSARDHLIDAYLIESFDGLLLVLSTNGRESFNSQIMIISINWFLEEGDTLIFLIKILEHNFCFAIFYKSKSVLKLPTCAKCQCMEGNIPVPKSKRGSGLNIVGGRNEFKNICARKMVRKDSSSVKSYQKLFAIWLKILYRKGNW